MEQNKIGPEIIQALIDFQSKAPILPKEKQVSYKAGGGQMSYSYCPFETMIKTIRPLMVECGLSFVQPITNEGVNTILLHKSGQYISSVFQVNVKYPDDPKLVGIGISYNKRYALASILGLASEDDPEPPEFKRDPMPDHSNSPIVRPPAHVGFPGRKQVATPNPPTPTPNPTETQKVDASDFGQAFNEGQETTNLKPPVKLAMKKAAPTAPAAPAAQQAPSGAIDIASQIEACKNQTELMQLYKKIVESKQITAEVTAMFTKKKNSF